MVEPKARDGSFKQTPPPAEQRAFERWLREDLARRYGKTVVEPLPEEWMRLLDPG